MRKSNNQNEDHNKTKDNVISTNEEIKNLNTTNLAEFVQINPDQKVDIDSYGNLGGYTERRNNSRP